MQNARWNRHVSHLFRCSAEHAEINNNLPFKFIIFLLVYAWSLCQIHHGRCCSLALKDFKLTLNLLILYHLWWKQYKVSSLIFVITVHIKVILEYYKQGANESNLNNIVFLNKKIQGTWEMQYMLLWIAIFFYERQDVTFRKVISWPLHKHRSKCYLYDSTLVIMSASNYIIKPRYWVKSSTMG